jgi:hypothetical protein
MHGDSVNDKTRELFKAQRDVPIGARVYLTKTGAYRTVTDHRDIYDVPEFYLTDPRGKRGGRWATDSEFQVVMRDVPILPNPSRGQLVHEAIKWLRDYLEARGGKAPARKLLDDAGESGFRRSTVYRAGVALRVVSELSGENLHFAAWRLSTPEDVANGIPLLGDGQWPGQHVEF